MVIIKSFSKNTIRFIHFQLRKTVFDFAQKELAPKAAEIDKTNSFPDMRASFIEVITFDLYIYDLLIKKL